MPRTLGIRDVLLSLGCLWVIACTPSSDPKADLVVVGTTVIDGTGADPRPNLDVFVSDGVITAVVESGSVEPPPGAQVVDAEGTLVIPGLADMHVHFSLGLPAPRSPEETGEVLRRLL